MSRDYKKLKVWEVSHNLVIKVYKVTKKFPQSEWLGLISQMRRSAVSIPANIVEGAGRKSQKEYLHFLQTALSSANELDYYIYLVKELEFIQNETYEELKKDTQQIIKMLQGLIYRINKDLIADG
ncbi:MAG TPA: hypothetical protein DHV62_08520 [Elusimicrobia bacterium]|jgi:four helix bundle protein|nr:hypothetical protein [Elusimicrobiota bacterium]